MSLQFKELSLGYASELDDCRLKTEYDQWNSKPLGKQLEPVKWYKKPFSETVENELHQLLNPELYNTSNFYYFRSEKTDL